MQDSVFTLPSWQQSGLVCQQLSYDLEYLLWICFLSGPDWLSNWSIQTDAALLLVRSVRGKEPIGRLSPTPKSDWSTVSIVPPDWLKAKSPSAKLTTRLSIWCDGSLQINHHIFCTAGQLYSTCHGYLLSYYQNRTTEYIKLDGTM